MKKFAFAFILMICCLAATTTFAQKDQTLFNKTGIRISGGWGGTSHAISKINDENAIFRGGFGGVELNKSVFLGWGGYETQNEILLESESGPTRFNMDYNGFVAGYAPQAFRTFHPQFMVMVAGGNVGDDKITVIQPSAGVEINVFRWFRVGLNGGYRIVTNTDLTGLSDGDLTTPYGEVKFKFGWSWGK